MIDINKPTRFKVTKTKCKILYHPYLGDSYLVCSENDYQGDEIEICDKNYIITKCENVPDKIKVYIFKSEEHYYTVSVSNYESDGFKLHKTVEVEV